MPKIIKTEVFTFEELSPKAKEKAREWLRECSAGDNYFSEAVIEDAVTVAKLFGLEIGTTSRNWHNTSTGKSGTTLEHNVFWSGFWTQGSGASFSGTYHHKTGALEAVKAYAPQDLKLHEIAETLENPENVMGFNITQSGHYSHENTMSFELLEHDSNGDEYGEVSREAEETVIEALKSFARWIYRQLEAEYIYTQSDEVIDESMIANKYTFTVDGKRFG